MLKKATSILLIVVTSAAIFHCSVPYMWYIVNYEYIVTELCVNRDRPEMHCNGMCQLRKMMHGGHYHNTHKTSSPDSQNRRIDLFTAENNGLIFVPLFRSKTSALYIPQIETLWFFEPPIPPPEIS